MAEALFNEVMYNDVLASNGFIVDYAICTTYSLDMPTLLSVPFMLGTMSELSGDAMQSPHYVLEAINKSTGKFAVFCNAGNIHVPQNTKTNIYSLLEKSIVQIALPSNGKGFVNFHPKVWVIKESNPDNGIEQLKVVVMSRNLSTSDDLDIVCEITGVVSNSPANRKKHKPLLDFLYWLQDKTKDRNIRKGIDELCDALSYVRKFETELPFEDYEFCPMGIPGHDGKSCLDKMLDHAAETIIISPFVDDNIVQQFAQSHPAARKTLITRHSSVTEHMLGLNDGVYAVKEVMTDRTEKDTCVDIHEKVYFIRNSQNYLNYLYLGSTNATTNGFGRNVEFLLQLQFKPYNMSYDKFRKELIYDDKDCMFEQVTSMLPQDDSDNDDVQTELELNKAIRAIYEARVSAASDGTYDIRINCKKNIANIPVYIHPLYSPALKQKLVDGVEFKSLPLVSVTEFYLLEVGDIKRVVKIDTKGMPVEERDKAIFQSVINTKSKFINYLAFMLTDDPNEFLAESQQIERELLQGGTSSSDFEMTTSLYEDMVRAAYTSPEKIEAVKNVMDKADKSVIPANFENMYNQFVNALKRTKRL
jgi:hypothetical protein